MQTLLSFTKTRVDESSIKQRDFKKDILTTKVSSRLLKHIQ